MQYLTLKEIQNEEKKILEETIKFLSKYNITYYIWAGSLLGCVRHKGFIPWDDDIDIAIPREDYNKLIGILKQNKCIITDNMKAIGFELGNFDAPFLKIINQNICVNELRNYDKNIWIDIFPLDGVPNRSKIFYKKVFLYKRIYFWKRSEIRKWEDDSNNILKRRIKKVLLFLLRPIKYHTIINKYIRVCSKYKIKNSEFVCHNVWGVGEKEKFPKQLLLETAKYKFEELEVKGIKDYDKWLTIRYGNYMQLPPENERETHSFKAWRVEKDDEQIKE